MSIAEVKNFYSLIEEKDEDNLPILTLILTAVKTVRLMMRFPRLFLIKDYTARCENVSPKCSLSSSNYVDILLCYNVVSDK